MGGTNVSIFLSPISTFGGGVRDRATPCCLTVSAQTFDDALETLTWRNLVIFPVATVESSHLIESP